jgi:hypothetical protein
MGSRSAQITKRAVVAEARIEAALALHVPFEKRGETYCHHCDPDYDVGIVEYPCPTVKALRGED